MQSRLKVLFIARWFPVRMDSMLGLFVVRHAQAVQLYADVTVITAVADSRLKNKTYDIEVEKNEFEAIKVYYQKSDISFINFYRNIRSYYIALKYYKKNNSLPDIVHVHVLSRTAIPALYLKLFHNIPYLITEHWSRYLPMNVKNSYTGFFRKYFTKIAVKNAYAVTTVTKNLKESMLALGLKNNYEIIPNAVDTGKFNINENKDFNNKHFIHVSCFEEKSKNIKGILNAISQLVEKRSDFKLFLVGDGADKEEIKELVNKNPVLTKHIVFTGLLEGEDLVHIIQNASFQILFSNYESQPSVILESFACGVPFISTSVGGIPDIINAERGILVDPQDTNGLCKAIDKLLDTYQKYDPEKIREFAVNHFSYPVVGKKFNDIYLSMLQHK